VLVSKVELKVDAEVEEDDDDDDEACCKIRVRASNRLVKCTVVAKHHEHDQTAPEKNGKKREGGR
jgi:hypothetical protein